MDEEGVAASTDDEMLSAMNPLLIITKIDLVAPIAHARVEAENWAEMKFTDMFFEGPLVKSEQQAVVLQRKFGNDTAII